MKPSVPSRFSEVVARLRQRNVVVAVRNRVLLKVGRKRRLLPHPYQNTGQASIRRIHRLLPEARDSRYLEIGLYLGSTFEAIPAAERVGVDPRLRFDARHLPPAVEIHETPSDAYFAGLAADERFDVVFLDGLHTYDQTYHDIVNALRHLRPGGRILVDDVVPSDEYSAFRDHQEAIVARRLAGKSSTDWHGDVFIVLQVLRDHHPELIVRTVVGSGNPQAIVWPSIEGASATTAVTADVLRSYASLRYQDVFADVIPPWFFPMTEDEALDSALAYRSPLRGAD